MNSTSSPICKPMYSLEGKVALVTGSTSGIGQAVARQLARAGAQVVLHGLASEEEAAVLCAQFREECAPAAPVHFHRADLAVPQEISGLIAQVHRQCGALDILVNNAGIQHVSGIEAFPPEVWDRMLAVNLSASFHTMRLALPGMRQRNWGRIINMASISGLRGRAMKSGYNATKHGLIGLTKAVALETASTGITCNAICPGWVHTPLVQKQVDALAARERIDNDAAVRALLGARQPSGQFVTREQIAALVLFLCSADAAEVRGAAWAIDGGTTAA